MPDEDQERVEDYLELERYIEKLQADHVAHLPEDMTVEQARIYHMVALFRSTASEAVEPRPEFLERLEAHLFTQLHPSSEEKTVQEKVSLSSDNRPRELAVPLQSERTQVRTEEQSSSPQKQVPRKRIMLSRRGLLTGAASVAASLGIGAGAEYTIERIEGTGSAAKTQGQDAGTTDSRSWNSATPLVGNVPTTWLHVTSLAELRSGAARFATDSIVGYVVHLVQEENHAKDYPDEVIALSAACTHMGCLVQWQDTDRRFHCPCHNGLFEASGEQVNKPGYTRYLAPLPRLKTKIENGNVYVEVPV